MDTMTTTRHTAELRFGARLRPGAHTSGHIACVHGSKPCTATANNWATEPTRRGAPPL